jgi:hypothetical protein
MDFGLAVVPIDGAWLQGDQTLRQLAGRIKDVYRGAFFAR